MTRPEVRRDAILRLRQADRMTRWELAAALQARADERRDPEPEERTSFWKVVGLSLFFILMLMAIAYGVPIAAGLVR